MTIYPAGTKLIRNDGVSFTADGTTDWGNSYKVEGEIPGTAASSVGGASNTQATYSHGNQPTSYYGYQRDTDWEGPNFTETKFAKDAAVSSGIVSNQFASDLFSDPSVVGFYVNALAYGGYTIGDVLNDIKRREMASQGNDEAENLKLIDPEVNKATYQNTAEGQAAYRESARIIPTFQLAGGMNPEVLKYGSNIPDELFKTLVPLLDRNSQEFKDAVENVKSAFYDMANQQLQATTEQEKAVADYNFQLFKDSLKEQYGIVLSDDATKAWKQIEDLENSFNTRGLTGSGLEREAIDNVLSATRKQDQRLRHEKLSKEELQQAATYTASATPAQIKALIAEDMAKGLPKEEWRATKWGLVPSDEVLAQYDMENLKKRYPDQSEAELKAYRDSVLDENGNYRSTLYSKYYSGTAANTAAKKATAETQVLQDALNKESSAYRNYDMSQPFSVATKKDDETVAAAAAATPNPANQATAPADTPKKEPEPTQDELAGIAAGIKKVQEGINNYTAGKAPTPTPTPTPGSTTPSTPTSSYIIQSGDTLSSLAAKNKTTVAELAKKNKITNPDKIYAGQSITF